MEQFALDGNVLHVSGELGAGKTFPHTGDFRNASQQLLTARDDTIVLDLTHASRVGSSFISELILLGNRASQENKTLLIRLSRHLHPIVKLIELPSCARLELVEAGAADRVQ